MLGIIDAPRLGERFLAHGSTGRLITTSGCVPLQTSGCHTLGTARLSTTDHFLFAAPERDAFERLCAQARLTRYSMDGYAYARLAAGGLDLSVESGLAPHDMNALVPVVTAAGGIVSNWRGGTDLPDGKLVAAASRQLLKEAVTMLRG